MHRRTARIGGVTLGLFSVGLLSVEFDKLGNLKRIEQGEEKTFFNLSGKV